MKNVMSVLALSLLLMSSSTFSYATDGKKSDTESGKSVVEEAQEKRSRGDEHNPAVDEILKLEHETSRQFQAGDLDWLVNLFAEDFVLLNPGSPIIIGKEHERKALEDALQMEGFEMVWGPTDAHVSESGDMAYAYGIINIKMPDGTELSEKYVTIWRKIEGNWKLVLQMRNANG